MYNDDTELLFPSRVIPALRTLRGEEWRDLIDRIHSLDPAHPDHLAFVLMMVRLGGCITCNADSFRAMRGCTQCARQTVKRFRGKDPDMLHLVQEALQEVERFLDKSGAIPPEVIKGSQKGNGL